MLRSSGGIVIICKIDYIYRWILRFSLGNSDGIKLHTDMYLLIGSSER